MRYFRRLPPLLRAASLLGLLFALAASVVLFGELIGFLLPPSLSRSTPVDADRLFIIALNLGMLGGACSLVVHGYTVRFRQPGGRGPFPLESWQSQVRAIVLPAALPICVLVVAVVIPTTSDAFEIVFPLSILGAVVFGMAYLNSLERWRAQS